MSSGLREHEPLICLVTLVGVLLLLWAVYGPRPDEGFSGEPGSFAQSGAGEWGNGTFTALKYGGDMTQAYALSDGDSRLYAKPSLSPFDGGMEQPVFWNPGSFADVASTLNASMNDSSENLKDIAAAAVASAVPAGSMPDRAAVVPVAAVAKAMQGFAGRRLGSPYGEGFSSGLVNGSIGQGVPSPY